MALPVLDKTWEHKVNQVVGGTDTYTAHRDYYFKIKESLVNGVAVPGTFTSPWAIWGTSDGSASFGNNDGVDRWAVKEDIVFSDSGNHSWIVLTNTAFSPSVQICWDMAAHQTQRQITFVVSPDGSFGAGAGGTDGTLSARPTAATEFVYGPYTDDGTQYAPWSGYLHILMSSDGECTRLALSRTKSGFTTEISNFLFVEKPRSPFAGWTLPMVWAFQGRSSWTGMIPTYGTFNEGVITTGRIGSNNCSFYLSSAAYAGDAVGQKITVPDDNTGQWPFVPMGLSCSTIGHRGVRKGSMFDMWWASTGTAYGTTYPDDGSRQFAQFGNMVFPWDGSNFLI